MTFNYSMLAVFRLNNPDVLHQVAQHGKFNESFTLVTMPFEIAKIPPQPLALRLGYGEARFRTPEEREAIFKVCRHCDQNDERPNLGRCAQSCQACGEDRKIPEYFALNLRVCPLNRWS